MEQLTLYEIWQGIKRRIPTVVVFTLVFALIAAVFSLLVLKPGYRSQTTLIIRRPDSYISDGQPAQPNNDIQMYQQLVRTYSEIVKSETVLDQVRNNLNLDLTLEELADKMKVQILNNSEMIKLAVTDGNAQGAADLANEIARVFSATIQDVMEEDNVAILDEARVHAVPTGPNIPLNVVIGGFLGFMAGLLYAIFKEFTHRSIRSAQDFTRTFDVPVIGSIPKY